MKLLNKRNLTVLTCVVLAGFLAIYALSWQHYKIVPSNPADAWNGANMRIASLTYSGESSAKSAGFKQALALNRELLDRIEQQADSDSGLISERTMHEAFPIAEQHAIQNQMAALEIQQERLSKDIDNLSDANTQLLEGQAILNNLDNDFAELAAFQQAEQERSDYFESLLQDSEDVPTEEDASALIAQHRGTQPQEVKGIPKKVLNNVQHTTGISPDEINDLLNQ